ncbi:cell envelope-related function transcriptional attenuator common domain-containing protein [Amycolatopsis australiensis]|uniref:Cell envelope-related function transcriptional attenuator common domain-containing protein n=1 Tax=Amycolatopsis australiensis TaxID=546364 RepID=A0A1K1RT64_9PSEU|nr:cell envelope-related function transcriptional attenuator common domain-containing protein [Amycolatopsis australiensis]
MVAGRVAVGLMSLLVLTGAGVASTMLISLAGGLNTSDALDPSGPKSLGSDQNILLIGLDSRKDQDGNQLPKEVLDQLHAGDGSEGGYNTNTLILMHIPGNGGKVSAVSIPRDDYVPVQGIPGYTKVKIKEAYGLAKFCAEQNLAKQGITDKAELEHKGREAGRKKTLETVRNFLDVPIDRFAEINLAGFYDLATALGGVEVCLNHPVKDSYSGADFPAGHQTLNGAQALSFVRQRHGLDNGDLDRTHRQQAFIASAAHKLHSVGTFTDLGKLQDLIDTAKRDVVISSGWDILAFAQHAQNLTGGDLEFTTLPIAGYEKVNGQDVNKVDTDQVRAAVRVAFGLVAPAPVTPQIRASATVDVRNATGKSGLASTVATALAPYGFRTGQLANTAATASSIAYGAGEKDDAATAASLLGGLPIAADSRVPKGHLRITLGTGFSLPAALGPHGADAAPGTPAAAATSAGTASAAEPPPAAGPQGGTVDGSGIPCVN